MAALKELEDTEEQALISRRRQNERAIAFQLEWDQMKQDYYPGTSKYGLEYGTEGGSGGGSGTGGRTGTTTSNNGTMKLTDEQKSQIESHISVNVDDVEDKGETLITFWESFWKANSEMTQVEFDYYTQNDFFVKIMCS